MEHGTWQPFETAPRDGTVIDLWAGGERYANYFFGKHEWMIISPTEGGDDGYTFDIFGTDEEEITHWMPLPEPPPIV